MVSPSSGERAPRRTSDDDADHHGRPAAELLDARPRTLPGTSRRSVGAAGASRVTGPWYGTGRAGTRRTRAPGRRRRTGGGRRPATAWARLAVGTGVGVAGRAGGGTGGRARASPAAGHRGGRTAGSTIDGRRAGRARSKWRSTSAHTSGSSGPRSSSESGARASSTPATDSRTKRNDSLDTNPATCWSLSGRSRITSTEWANAG